MHETPARSTSSAMAKASAKVVFSLATRNRFWFGMTSSVSTYFCSSMMPALGRAHAPLAFELERLGHDADGEDAFLARGAGDDGSSTCAGSAAHAGGDERHVAAGEMRLDVGHGFFSRRRADVGLGAGAEAFGDMGAHLDAALGARAQQCLRIGVGDDELDAAQAGGDHVVDGVAARSAHTEHGDPRLELGEIWNLEIDRHGGLLS